MKTYLRFTLGGLIGNLGVLIYGFLYNMDVFWNGMIMLLLWAFFLMAFSSLDDLNSERRKDEN